MFGADNAIAFTYRIEDARIGRFLSIDPLAAKYPSNSPYAFSENRVLDRIELEGLESTIPPVNVDPAAILSSELANSVTNSYLYLAGDDDILRAITLEAGLNPDDFLDDFQVRAAIVYYPVPGVFGETSETEVAFRREYVIEPKSSTGRGLLEFALDIATIWPGGLGKKGMRQPAFLAKGG